MATLLLSGLSAQFGVSGSYRISQDGFTDLDHPNGGVFGNGYEVGLDYWFRLPNQRIEFLPTLSYGSFSGEANSLSLGDEIDFSGSNLTFRLQEIGFQFKTNVYIFDLGTDCNCPTFGKQGPALHKGFFLQLAAGYSVFWTESQLPFLNFTLSEQRRQALPNLSIGAGVDFGLSNLITLSPYLHYRHYFGDFNWTETYSLTPLTILIPNERKANLSDFQLGMRVGIRLDKRRY